MSATIVSGRLAKVLADIFDIPAEDIRPELAAGNIEAWGLVRPCAGYPCR